MYWDIRHFRREHNLTHGKLAELLRISLPYLQILESPPDLVPDASPNHIADRLNILERALAGQVRRMPEAHCPLHNCRLEKYEYKVRCNKRLPGKMNCWWARCVMGRELYTVRSDGLVQDALRQKTGTGGRPPKADNKKQNFIIGSEVETAKRDRFERFIEVRRSLPKRYRSKKELLRGELSARGFSGEEIAAGISARSATIAARNYVAILRNLEFRTVANYHWQYVSLKSPHALSCPVTLTKNSPS
jgi:hypothetical protein